MNRSAASDLHQRRSRIGRGVCLATGAELDAAIGPRRDKGSGELGLVRLLLEGFRPGDVMLADALYCNYFLIAALVAKGVDVLFEQNGSCTTDFRRSQSLGTRDHIVRWPKPAARPEWMTPEQYAQSPDEITQTRTGAAQGGIATQAGKRRLSARTAWMNDKSWAACALAAAAWVIMRRMAA